jgi:hypothetical protein
MFRYRREILSKCLPTNKVTCSSQSDASLRKLQEASSGQPTTLHTRSHGIIMAFAFPKYQIHPDLDSIWRKYGSFRD